MSSLRTPTRARKSKFEGEFERTIARSRWYCDKPGVRTKGVVRGIYLGRPVLRDAGRRRQYTLRVVSEMGAGAVLTQFGHSMCIARQYVHCYFFPSTLFFWFLTVWPMQASQMVVSTVKEVEMPAVAEGVCVTL
jgi:hypothetical protein